MDPSIAIRLRDRLRRPGDALSRASIGTVPILWNNVDVPELRLDAPASTVIDEIARTGYEGTQLGLGFPEGAPLRAALSKRGLRLAEVYAAIPVTADGPDGNAAEIVRERLRILVAGDGEVLCMALESSPERSIFAGRAVGRDTPRLSEPGWRALAELLNELALQTTEAGRRAVFHPHVGTFVETPDEVGRLIEVTNPGVLGICLDVGHYLVGGGDPVAGLQVMGEQVSHVHLKDVDPDVLALLRAGEIGSFGDAVRARLFTELGVGILDLEGVLAALVERDYRGWLMVEQDSAWGPPSEAAAISRRVLASALRRLGREQAA
jgi:inosose dehydratase